MSAFRVAGDDRPFPRGWLLSAGVGRWVLLGTAVLQAVSPAVVPFSGDGDGPPIVPAGYTFVIWTPIVLGCVAAALYGLPRRRASSAAYRAVHLRLSAVQVLFVAWLLAAVSPAVGLTVPIFVAMLVLTLAALRRVLSSTGRAHKTVRWLLGGTLGLYAGWSTAALWVNLASLLPEAGLSPDGILGTTWQVALLAAATATAVVLVRRLAAPVPYVAAVAWAFGGVVVSGLTAGRPGLTVAAGAGLLTVLATAVRAGRTTSATWPAC